MGGVLPDYIEPLRLAEAKAHLGGTMPLGRLPRMASLLVEGTDAGDVSIDFRFGDDGEGHPVLTGRLNAAVPVTCQRCLQVMTVHIDAPVRLRLIRHEGEAPSNVDALLIASEAMPLAAIVEEELLLSMPMTTRHLEADCPAKLPGRGGAAGEHPFAVLAALKKDGRKQPDVE